MEGDDDEAPHQVEVPSGDVGRLIGPNGSTLKRLVQATGCRLEIPRGGRRQEDAGGTVVVQLVGRPASRRAAAAAVRDIVAGGDAEDHAAKADGAMVIRHGLDEEFERRSWAAWRLIPVEVEHKVRVDMGRRALRLWAATGTRGLHGPAAERARAAAEAVVAEAKELVELKVDAPLDFDPQSANFDAAVRPLVDQHGVLVRIPLPEDGRVALRVVGPTEAARDAALLLEARFVKGKFTASLLQVPGQVQAMPEEMSKEFTEDLRSLEAESQVKCHLGHAVLWLTGANAEAVTTARETLREMLLFYLPQGFQVRHGLSPPDFLDLLRKDEPLRALAARPGCAFCFEPRAGTAWLCGGEDARAPVRERIDELLQKWASEHWEMDLDNYGAAMWLLGPSGTGGWLQRMQAESGAAIRVCPNNLKVSAEGRPCKVEAAKRLILDAMARLRQKQDADAGVTISEVATKKAKALLTEHPPHMQAILESLRVLEARETEAKRRARLREWDRSRSRSRRRRGPGPVDDRPAPAAAAEPPRTQQPEQGGDEPQPRSVEEPRAPAADDEPEDADLLRGLRQRVAKAATLPQTLPPAEARGAGVARLPDSAPGDAVIQVPDEDDADEDMSMADASNGPAG